MRFFDWVDFQYEMLAVFMGMVAAILVYVAWAAYPHRRHSMPAEGPEERAGREPSPVYEKNPVTPFIIATYVIIACWAFAYMIHAWASSKNF